MFDVNMPALVTFTGALESNAVKEFLPCLSV
jgi:hypothetical protein